MEGEGEKFKRGHLSFPGGDGPVAGRVEEGIDIWGEELGQGEERREWRKEGKVIEEIWEGEVEQLVRELGRQELELDRRIKEKRRNWEEEKKEWEEGERWRREKLKKEELEERKKRLEQVKALEEEEERERARWIAERTRKREERERIERREKERWDTEKVENIITPEEMMELQEMLKKGREAERRKSGLKEGKLNSLPKLDCYDGRQDWGDFRAQLERHMRARGWDIEEMPDILAMHLKGDALRYFEHLSREAKNDYFQAITFMTTRFAKSRSVETIRSLFMNANQAENESLRDFAGRLRALAIEAFPGLPLEFVEGEMIRRFQDGCVCKDLVLLSCVGRPKSLEEVVSSMESLSERQRSLGGPRKVRAVCTDDKNVPSGLRYKPEGKTTNISNPKPAEISMSSRLDRLENLLEKLNRDQGKIWCQGCKIRHTLSDCTFKGSCFRCKQPGHFSTFCPLELNQ